MFFADFIAEIFRLYDIELPFISSGMTGFSWSLGIFTVLISIKILKDFFTGGDK